MRNFRYHLDGQWCRGNTHIHSVASDGGKTVEELEEMYADAGYDFLCLTDHWVASAVQERQNANGLLWFDGVELHGTDLQGVMYHIACIGKFSGIDKEMGLEAGFQAVLGQGGFTILAHPHWTGNTFQETQVHNFDAVEVYNHVCHWLNGKGDGQAYWDYMLTQDPGMLVIACDDAHLQPQHPGWNGGWLMVNAVEKSHSAILASLRAGNYYASCGPEIRSLEFRDGMISVETSPVQFIRLVGANIYGKRVGSFDGSTLTSAKFEVPPNWPYAYIEVEDHQRRRAWTNNLFLGFRSPDF
jgi:hypothetical protein